MMEKYEIQFSIKIKDGFRNQIVMGSDSDWIKNKFHIFEMDFKRI